MFLYECACGLRCSGGGGRLERRRWSLEAVELREQMGPG